jgi:hypothetical protein
MPHAPLDEREFCQIPRQNRQEQHYSHSQAVPNSLFLGRQHFRIRRHEPVSPETQKKTLADPQLVNPLHIHFEPEPELVLNEGDCADGGDVQRDGGEGAENEGVGVLHVYVGGEAVDADVGASVVLCRLFQILFPKEEDC